MLWYISKGGIEIISGLNLGLKTSCAEWNHSWLLSLVVRVGNLQIDRWYYNEGCDIKDGAFVNPKEQEAGTSEHL
jgi:hypothetical protein